MPAKLEWAVDQAGFTAQVVEQGRLSPWGEWAWREVHAGDARADLGPLLARLEAAGLDPDLTEATLPHDAIVGLPDDALARLGLPPRLPHALVVRAEGDLGSSDFQASVVLLDGTRSVAFSRAGGQVTIGSRRFLLSLPQLRFLEALGSFLAAVPVDASDRMAAWSEVRALAPADTRFDEYLQEESFVYARSFALTLHPGPSGEITLEPELVSLAEGDAEGPPRRLLDEGERRNLQALFRRQPSVRRRLVLAGGRIVVLSEPLRRALQVVHRAQRASSVERRAFVESPRAFLREHMEADFTEETIEAVFADFGYGDRVREVAPWVPVPLDVVPSGQRWFEDAPNTALREGSPLVANADAGDVAAKPPLVAAIADNRESVEARAYPHARPELPARGARVRTALKRHQEDALVWLCELWRRGSAGALLADDMGLGKTLTALAFLSTIRGLRAPSGAHGPVLVVAPTGLLYNWIAEAERHLAPGALGERVDGFGTGLAALRIRQRGKEAEALHGKPSLDLPRLQSAGWALTTYETVRDYQHSFARVKWAALVLDEAQRVKNPAAGVTNAIKALQAEFVVALTGTPVENRLADLWTIVDRVSPGFFGALTDFQQAYERPLAETASAELERLGRELNARLTSEPASLMKRRMKRDHIEGLPDKTVHVTREPMGPAQAAAYEAVLAQARGARSRDRRLALLQQLRNVSLHPGLGGEGRMNTHTLAEEAARLRPTFAALDGIAQRREKALVFVELLEFQGHLLQLLQRRYALPRPPMVISGEVTSAQRQARVDRFQAERDRFDVMVLSPKAGGVGLTLTAANHVVHLTRWWNPAVEDQATDRVHRIGQERDVNVYLPLAIHPRVGERSFDVLLHNLLERKRTLSGSVLTPLAPSDGEIAAVLDEALDA